MQLSLGKQHFHHFHITLWCSSWYLAYSRCLCKISFSLRYLTSMMLFSWSWRKEFKSFHMKDLHILFQTHHWLKASSFSTRSPESFTWGDLILVMNILGQRLPLAGHCLCHWVLCGQQSSLQTAHPHLLCQILASEIVHFFLISVKILLPKWSNIGCLASYLLIFCNYVQPCMHIAFVNLSLCG
jgi:hypothetical protein